MTGRRVWWYFVAFFGAVIAVNSVMVTLALRTHSGTVTDHPYEKGLAYNQVVRAEEEQEARGWKGEIAYRDAMLHFTLHDRNNRAILPEKVIAAITRPTQQGMDFEVALSNAGTAVEFPAKGLWEVRVDAVYKDMHYQQSRRIVVE